jgi:hypothetical protein
MIRVLWCSRPHLAGQFAPSSDLQLQFKQKSYTAGVPGPRWVTKLGVNSACEEGPVGWSSRVLAGTGSASGEVVINPFACAVGADSLVKVKEFKNPAHSSPPRYLWSSGLCPSTSLTILCFCGWALAAVKSPAPAWQWIGHRTIGPSRTSWIFCCMYVFCFPFLSSMVIASAV